MAENSDNIEYERFKEQDVEKGLFDVSFKINDQILHAHSLKLSSKSKIFEDMFSQNPEYLEPIEITAASFEAFKEFISYFYHLSFNFTPAFIIEITELADEYEVDSLINLIDEHLSKISYKISTDYEMLKALNILKLQKFRKGVQTNFYSCWTCLYYKNFLKNPHFMTATKKAIIGMLTLERNNDSDVENLVFEKVVLWVKTQASTMHLDNSEEYIKKEMATLLPKFDFTKMSFYFLKPFTDTYTCLFPSPEYIEDILNQSDKSIYKAILDGHYSLGKPRYQNFALMPSLMNYLTRNWSAEVYQKLAKSCKYFFYNYPIIVIQDMKTISTKTKVNPELAWHYGYYEGNMYLILRERRVLLDLSVKKLWLLGDSDLIGHYYYLHKHVYVSELKKITLTQWSLKEPYLYKDFAKMVLTLTSLEVQSDIYLESGILTLGDILSHTPNLMEFESSYQMKPSTRAHNISPSITIGLPKLPKLKKFILYPIFSFLDYGLMLQFIKNHDAKFLLGFSDQTSYDSFKAAGLEAYSSWEKETLHECRSSDYFSYYRRYCFRETIGGEPPAKIIIATLQW